MALTILGITFFGFLILGVPVAFAIALSAVCTILYEGLPVAVLFFFLNLIGLGLGQDWPEPPKRP